MLDLERHLSRGFFSRTHAVSGFTASSSKYHNKLSPCSILSIYTLQTPPLPGRTGQDAVSPPPRRQLKFCCIEKLSCKLREGVVSSTVSPAREKIPKATPGGQHLSLLPTAISIFRAFRVTGTEIVFSFRCAFCPRLTSFC